MESRLNRVESDIAKINLNLDKLTEIISKGKGTWAVAVTLMGLAGTIIVGIVISFVSNLISGKT